MADFANAARAFDVMDAANLEIRLTITVYVQDELENVLRRSPDYGSPLAADHDRFRHRLYLRRSRPDPFREQAKITQPEGGPVGQSSFNAQPVEGCPRDQIGRQSDISGTVISSSADQATA